MPTLVAPTITRFSLNQSYLGRAAVNVLDFSIGDEFPATDRHDAIAEVAAALIDNWYDFINSGLVADLVFDSVSWVDLDSVDGETGELTEGNDHSLPLAGSVGGDAISANTAILIRKLTTGGRRTRNGRMYVAGIPESQIDGNLLSSTYQGNMQDSADAFLTAMTDTAIWADFSVQMRIVHTENTGTPDDPVIEFVSSTNVTGLVLEQRVASQRRRNRP